MKKKCLIAILFMVMVFAMNGCGKSNVENVAEKTQQEQALIDEKVEDIYTEEPVKESTSAIDELLQFEVMDEVKNSEFGQGYIQVADVAIPAMSTVGDIMTLLENSSLEWEYEYNPNQLVLYDTYVKEINIYYKGLEVFSISAKNWMADKSTISLKDCLVTLISITDDYSQCFYYAKGYAGNGANVEDYTTYSNTYKNSEYYTEYSHDNIISVKYGVPFATRRIDSMGIEFFNATLYIYADFNPEDGTCISFHYENDYSYMWKKTE